MKIRSNFWTEHASFLVPNVARLRRICSRCPLGLKAGSLRISSLAKRDRVADLPTVDKAAQLEPLTGSGWQGRLENKRPAQGRDGARIVA